MGLEVSTSTDCSKAFEDLREKRSKTIIEPVQIAWGGWLSAIDVRISDHIPIPVKAKLELEGRETRYCQWKDPARYSRKAGANARASELRLPIQEQLPYGYHSLTLEIGNDMVSTLIVSAPHKAPEPRLYRQWGLFSPLYTINSESSWGAGDLSDLGELARWSSSFGGSFAGTLPLLPAFYREQYNHSPYSPVSRLFWNEFFIDVSKVPEMNDCAEAGNLLGSTEFKTKITQLRSEALVDYGCQMELKRRILELLAGYFFGLPDTHPRQKKFKEFLKNHSNVKDYARFRTVSERLKIPWTEWPERMRNGSLYASDSDPKVEQYHLYAQFIVDTQLTNLRSNAKEAGQRLYLDLPLGANPDGYDAWKYDHIFARAASVGAPPDPAFIEGQDWGFPPPHPERLRESGYRYFIEVVRHHLRFASLLRLDHIMGLHRLYWIPAGLSSEEGVYVRYEAEELYAILCLEAYRANCVIVGEDLGLVPGTVRQSMRRHNIYRSYVAQYEMLTGNDNCLDAIPVHAVATVNTHDMHPFAAFWAGTDIGERIACGVLSRERATTEIKRRDAHKAALVRNLRLRKLIGTDEPTTREIYHAICRVLAASDVQVLMLSLDDLVGSVQAQNIPGTCLEHPNWRRRETRSLEQLENDQSIGDFLSEINRTRKINKDPVGG
jgi:4-alpha-glucanotransferase